MSDHRIIQDGRVLADRALAVPVEPAGSLAASRVDPSREEVFAPRSTDDEASAILDDLSKLQTLLTLQMRHGPVWMAAADLVQRTRILIIERCKRGRPSTPSNGEPA